MTNREKQSKTYIPLLMENQDKVAKINQVGSYAISIAWKDGHNTGIYEYPFLKKLADEYENVHKNTSMASWLRSKPTAAKAALNL